MAEEKQRTVQKPQEKSIMGSRRYIYGGRARQELQLCVNVRRVKLVAWTSTKQMSLPCSYSCIHTCDSFHTD